MEECRLDRENDREEEYPYQLMIINDFEKINVNTTKHKCSNGQYLAML